MKMKWLVCLFVMGYLAKCDDSSNYYVVDMRQEDPPVQYRKPFRVYWNVPTMQCSSKKIPFDNLYQKYGIIQNTNDSFRGDKITILYDPGYFPAIFEGNGEKKYRNGGVPQEGDLTIHLKAFRKTVEESIPDPSFRGVGVIDFESWRPVFRQNFGSLTTYKEYSYEIESQKHWFWPTTWKQQEAKKRFEEAGRRFMQTTISVAKQMRPHALWGYYGFPYCFNMNTKDKRPACSSEVQRENENIHWLWEESTALFPSIYSSVHLTTSELQAMIRGRLAEASRVSTGDAPILPYFWYRYRDDSFLTQKDLDIALQTIYESNASGFIIWGSSRDVNTPEKCEKLLEYVNTTFGPSIAKYTKRNIYNDEAEITTTTEEDTSTTQTMNYNEIITTTFPYNQNISTNNVTDQIVYAESSNLNNIIRNETTLVDLPALSSESHNIDDNKQNTENKLKTPTLDIREYQTQSEETPIDYLYRNTNNSNKDSNGTLHEIANMNDMIWLGILKYAFSKNLNDTDDLIFTVDEDYMDEDLDDNKNTLSTNSHTNVVHNNVNKASYASRNISDNYKYTTSSSEVNVTNKEELQSDTSTFTSTTTEALEMIENISDSRNFNKTPQNEEHSIKDNKHLLRDTNNYITKVYPFTTTDSILVPLITQDMVDENYSPLSYEATESQYLLDTSTQSSNVNTSSTRYFNTHSTTDMPYKNTEKYYSEAYLLNEDSINDTAVTSTPEYFESSTVAGSTSTILAHGLFCFLLLYFLV